MARLLIQMGGLLIHHCCGCRGSPPLVAHSTQHPAHMHHVSFHHIIQYVSRVNIMFYITCNFTPKFTLPNTTNNEHIKLPPASAHFNITFPRWKVDPGLAACCGARRPTPPTRQRRPRATAPVSASRPPTAGGRRIKRLCAHCLSTPLRAMPAAPPLHPLRLSSLENSLPRRAVVTVNVKCPPLDDFNQGPTGGLGLGRPAAASPAHAGVPRCVRLSPPSWPSARGDDRLLPLARYAHSCRPVRLLMRAVSWCCPACCLRVA